MHGLPLQLHDARFAALDWPIHCAAIVGLYVRPAVLQQHASSASSRLGHARNSRLQTPDAGQPAMQAAQHGSSYRNEIIGVIRHREACENPWQRPHVPDEVCMLEGIRRAACWVVKRRVRPGSRVVSVPAVGSLKVCPQQRTGVLQLRWRCGILDDRILGSRHTHIGTLSAWASS